MLDTSEKHLSNAEKIESAHQNESNQSNKALEEKAGRIDYLSQEKPPIAVSKTEDRVNMQISHREYALLSAHSYYIDVQSPEDASFKAIQAEIAEKAWEIIGRKITKDGFAATAYRHSKSSKVVVAFRGTILSKHNIATNEAFLIKHLPDTLLTAIDFIEHIINKYNLERKNISLTGHSLGGAIAELCACRKEAEDHRINAVTFESPGVYEIIKNHSDKFVIDLHILRQRITTYLTAPNAINTLGSHVGSCYRIFIPLTEGLNAKHVIGCVSGTTTRFMLIGTLAYSMNRLFGSATSGNAANLQNNTNSVGIYNSGSIQGRTIIVESNRGVWNTSTGSIIAENEVSIKALGGKIINEGIIEGLNVLMHVFDNTTAPVIIGTGLTAAGVSLVTRFIASNIAAQAVPTIDFLFRQHSILNIIAQFNKDTGTANNHKFVISWPLGLIKKTFFPTEIAKTFVPFHPENRGLHNLYH